MLKKALIALIVLLLLYAGVTYYFSSLILHTPDRDIATVYQMNRERWDLDLEALQRTLPPREEVKITSQYDGTELKGWLFRPDTVRCGVVFAHGYSVNRANMLKYAPIFDDCGCALLFYDHRGHGESAPEAYGSGGWHEAEDLMDANTFLRNQTGLTAGQIGWFGESWGGATVLIAAARAKTDKPAWVVSESAYADWTSAIMERGLKQYGNGLKALTPGAFTWVNLRADVVFDEVSPLALAPTIDVPTLLIHSTADTLTYPEQFDRLVGAFDPEVVTAHKLDWGAWHAHNVIWDRPAYTGLVRDFIGDFCGSPLPPPDSLPAYGRPPAPGYQISAAPPRTATTPLTK